jgi:hypothetical protein
VVMGMAVVVAVMVMFVVFGQKFFQSI